MKVQTSDVLNKVVCVNLDVSIWGGRRKLRPEDLRLQGQSIPPEDLASLGSKKICSPKDLSAFGALKKRALRYLESIGIRFLGGFAIPEERIDEVHAELDEIQRLFLEAKSDFLGRYDQAIEEWIEAYPTWADIIRNSILPASQVSGKLDFRFQAFKVNMPEAEKIEAEANAGLEKTVSGLKDQLFVEVADQAQVLWNTIQKKDKQELRPSVLITIEGIRKKLNGLSFLDSGVRAVVASIDKAVQNIASDRKIEGGDFYTIYGLVSTLSSREKMLKVAQAIQEYDTATEAKAAPVADPAGAAVQDEDNEIEAQAETETEAEAAPVVDPAEVAVQDEGNEIEAETDESMSDPQQSGNQPWNPWTPETQPSTWF